MSHIKVVVVVVVVVHGEEQEDELHTFVVTSLQCVSGYSKESVSEFKKRRILFIGR